MRAFLRIFIRVLMSLVFLAGTPVFSGQPALAAVGEDRTASTQDKVPDSSGRVEKNASLLFPETGSGVALWLLLGAAGLALGLFWWKRRFRDPVVQTAMPRMVQPARGAGKPAGDGEAGEMAESRYWTSLDGATTVTVDELSSVEEEAEVFLLLGRMDLAIGVLRHYIEANDDAPASVWMRLLDILHVQGLRHEFEKLAAEIRERFNITQPSWEVANRRSNDLAGLEHLPHLLGKLIARWNEPECLAYLHSLVQDKRQGEREGFDLETFREILMLIDIQEQGRAFPSKAEIR